MDCEEVVRAMSARVLAERAPAGASVQVRWREMARTAAESAGLALACVAAERASRLFLWEGGHVSPVWVPAGVALAALFLRGRRLWPGLLVGFFAAALQRGAPPHLSFLLASVNT